MPYSAQVVYTMDNGSKFRVPVKGHFSGKATWKGLHFETEILGYYVEEESGVLEIYTKEEMKERYFRKNCH